MKNIDPLILKFDNSFNGRLFAVQADTGRVINLQIFNDLDTPVDITGMSLRFYIGNSEQVSYSDGTITDAAQGKVEVPITNSMLAYSGINKAQFVLTEKDGKKVGSKVFDMHIDESVENGSTIGRNIVVDYSKIDEALKLLKDYDKTLQEAKETDLKLKVDIDVATETDNKLKENIELARTFDFDGDIQKAKETRDDLVIKTTAGEKAKTDLDGSIATAKDTKAGLEESTATANSTKTVLDSSTKTAKTANTVLTQSINGSNTAKTNLDTSIGKAETAKTGLDDSIGKGSALKQGIESDIATATTLKSDLSKAVTSADTKKTELATQIQKAETTNTALSDTDTKAKSTKTDLEKLLQDLNLTKGQVQEIIASGNLDQYVTDVKLQNELKAYATKEDLQSIDVTSQLGDYAKKTEVPTKLSELENDKEFVDSTILDETMDSFTTNFNDTVGNSITDLNNRLKSKADINKVPTKLSQLTNDSNFKTETEIQSMISNASKLKKEVVTSLPTTGKDDVIYLVKNKFDENNVYTEYLWIGGKWEIIGDTKVDLSGYVEKVEGKNLSSNDFTDDLKTKLDNIEDEANKTTIVNDLTTGGVDKALSAEQGKVLFQNVDDGKLQIANAIIDKGETGVSNNSSFQELATGIRSIKIGYGVGDIIKPADVKVLSRTEEKPPSKVWGFTGHTGIVRAVAVDNSGNVYSGGEDKKIIKISPTGSKVWEFTGNTDTIYGLAVDSKGNICSSSNNGRLMKISPNKQKIWEFTGLNNRIPSVVVDSKDYIYACDVNKIVKISPTGSKVWEFTGISDGVYTLATDNNDYIYAGSEDKKTTKISPTGSKVWEFTGHTNYVRAITVDSKGNVYASDMNKLIKISSQRQKVWEFAVNGSFGAAITIDNEDNIYFADSDAKVTKISPTGSKIWESKEHIYSLNAVAVDDNNNVYTGSNDKTVIKIHQNIEYIPTGYEVLR